MTIDFESSFLTRQLITYIGNKRALLPFINVAVERVKKRLGKKKISAFDGFAGSGAVARLLKCHASELWVNDLESYSEILNKCYLANKSEADIDFIGRTIRMLNARRHERPPNGPGFIERNYAPRNDDDIKPLERVFYTNRNARAIDNVKRVILDEAPPEGRHFFMAPLLVEASIHTNTSGVFKGFHKNGAVGCFGGRGAHALERIKKDIVLEIPALSDAECPIFIKKSDTTALVKSKEIPSEFDLAYYDPPYNQHPYGSNYFMLNIIASESENLPIQNGISGITENWNRSPYNKRSEAARALDELLKATPAKYILISYNEEGLIGRRELSDILRKRGKLEVMSREYNVYRGSRNLRGRNIKVMEMLWLLKKD